MFQSKGKVPAHQRPQYEAIPKYIGRGGQNQSFHSNPKDKNPGLMAGVMVEWLRTDLSHKIIFVRKLLKV